MRDDKKYNNNIEITKKKKEKRKKAPLSLEIVKKTALIFPGQFQNYESQIYEHNQI